MPSTMWGLPWLRSFSKMSSPPAKIGAVSDI
jgi:hypothetical protein